MRVNDFIGQSELNSFMSSMINKMNKHKYKLIKKTAKIIHVNISEEYEII